MSQPATQSDLQQQFEYLSTFLDQPGLDTPEALSRALYDRINNLMSALNNARQEISLLKAENSRLLAQLPVSA